MDEGNRDCRSEGSGNGNDNDNFGGTGFNSGSGPACTLGFHRRTTIAEARVVAAATVLAAEVVVGNDSDF